MFSMLKLDRVQILEASLPQAENDVAYSNHTLSFVSCTNKNMIGGDAVLG